jgi:hypothetical protein
MHYLIEDNIDFYKAISETNNTDENMKIEVNNTDENMKIEVNNTDENMKIEVNDNGCCLISNTDLSDNFITLDCNHSFNYVPLYKELTNQKKINALEVVRLKDDQIKCPYCRKISDYILPMFSLYNLPSVFGVNMPSRYSKQIYSCEYIFKSGKAKGVACNKSACVSGFGILCNTHFALMKKPKKPQVKRNEKKGEDNKEPINIKLHETQSQSQSQSLIQSVSQYNLYKITQLKDILRANACKVSGTKAELIDRILQCSLKKGVLWNNIFLIA